MTSLNKQELIQQIGEDVYNHLDKEAVKEVGLAMAMPLIDQYRQEKYYRRRPWLGVSLNEMSIFEEKGLKISPLDVTNILFRSKLLFAVQNEEEYSQRSGGGISFDPTYSFRFEERVLGIDAVVDEHLTRLVNTIKEQTLISEISHFIIPEHLGDPDQFFQNLFLKLKLPFAIFFDNTNLIKKYQDFRPNLSRHDQNDARRFFCSPSAGFTVTGSPTYAYLYASTWLRTFLNMLRIGGFIYRPQLDFGNFESIPLMAPTSPVLLGENSMGTLVWDEDTKRPWEKIPDGCLFLSFGYRGLSKMYLDSRVFGGLEKFFNENKIIFENLKNPWKNKNIDDISPALDILSSTTQIPDLGAKILLIYCCLEHLFVPKNIRKDNVKYIIGGINALRPDLLEWFNRLYQVRCDYAHKGFIIRDDSTRGLVFESVSNAMSLLTSKLKQL